MRSHTLYFLGGIVLCLSLTAMPPVWLIAVLLVVMRIARCLAGLVVLLGLCFTLSIITSIMAHDLPEHQLDHALQIQGEIDSLPACDSRGCRLLLTSHNCAQCDIQSGMSLQIFWPQPMRSLRVGQVWRMWVKLKRIVGPANIGSVDSEAQALARGLRYRGTVQSRTHSPVLLAQRMSGQSLRQRLYQALQDKQVASPNWGLIPALTLGIRSDLTPEVWRLFRLTGTSHLIAISGLHIGLVFGALWLLASFLLRLWPLLSLWIPRQQVAKLLALCGAIFYSYLAGFAIPTVRALVLICFTCFFSYRRRYILPSYLLCASLGVVLWCFPLSVLSASFWLSFGAVFWIAYVSHRLGDIRWWHLQGVIGFGLMPLSLWFFQGVSVVSFLANAIAIPWISWLVVPPALLAIVFTLIWPKASVILLKSALYALQPLTEGLSRLADRPWAMLYWHLSFWQLCLLTISLAWLFAPRGLPGRVLGCIGVLVILLFQGERPELGQAQVTVLDVGQGLSVVIQTHRHIVVYDAGPRFVPFFDAGAQIVVPFLRANTISKLDTLVVSHGDNDHMGGVSALQSAFPGAVLRTSVPGRFPGKRVFPCRAGQAWRYDGVHFEMLSPLADSVFHGNNRSCVLRVRAGHESVLLTGDIEWPAESVLLRTGVQLKSTVLIAPHHGSATSSSVPFIRAVSPDIVIYPSGYRNAFHHPHQEVVARYQLFGARSYITSVSGALTFTLGEGSGLHIHEYRSSHPHLWSSGIKS